MKSNKEILLHEILEQAQEYKTEGPRIKFLKKHDTFAFRTILQLAFSKSIELDFPEGAPPYKELDAPIGLEPVRLKNVIKGLGSCVKGNNIPIVKKERILIGLLEQIHANDAKALIAAKDKELDKIYTNITSSIVEKAFPNLIK
tara:strand:- start:1283 stop:1714 length:432 start_codon:yes stop_codon:yes gene_type:complete